MIDINQWMYKKWIFILVLFRLAPLSRAFKWGTTRRLCAYQSMGRGLGIDSLSDIFSEEDINRGMNRVKQLSLLLELPEGDISVMVTRYPLLMTMEKDKISKLNN